MEKRLIFLLGLGIVVCDDSYIDHKLKVACDDEYIPDNCGYPIITLERMVTGEYFERCAPAVLTKDVRNFFGGAAGRKETYYRNFEGLKRAYIVPRLLHDVSNSDLHTTVLGSRISFPVGISPSAAQKLAHPIGEVGTAKAAASIGTAMILSSVSQTAIEEVARAAFSVNRHDVLWMETTHILKDRLEVLYLLRRAERAQWTALLLLLLAVMVEVFCLISGRDAIKAAEVGVSAILVSNHGSRQMDSVKATIDVLPEIVSALRPRFPSVEVYMDGGVRNGGDVFKVLARESRAAFVGRPALWGLSIAGEHGVRKMLTILRSEFNETMLIAGYANPEGIYEDMVLSYQPYFLN